MGAGGGASGSTDFPAYMKMFHFALMSGQTDIDEAPGVMPTVTLMQAFNSAVSGNSPFYSYLTDTEPIARGFMGGSKTLNSYDKIFDLLETFQDINFDTTMAGYNSGSSVADLTAAVSSSLDDDISNNILPKFHGNLRSCGAVMSSAFAVGEALIWDSKIKALAKERLQIEQVVNQNKETALKLTLSYLEYKKTIVTLSTDIVKVYLSLKTDLAKHYAEMNASDRKWDLETFQYCNNTLASISGAALHKGTQTNPVGAAVSGMLSGAAMGAMATGGNPIGIGAGAALGLAGGLFSGK